MEHHLESYEGKELNSEFYNPWKQSSGKKTENTFSVEGKLKAFVTRISALNKMLK